MYTFSEHALERINERLTMSPEWVLALLENNAVEVNHICAEDINNRHLAFWSIPDELAFVAVVDIADRHVITIFPASPHVIHKHQNRDGRVYATRVSNRTIFKCMRLVGLKKPKHREVGDAPPKQGRAYHQVFVARFLTREGKNKTKEIGRMTESDDLEDVLPSVIEAAVDVSVKFGTLGLTIELRNRGCFDILQEWVMDEAVVYGVGE